MYTSRPSDNFETIEEEFEASLRNRFKGNPEQFITYVHNRPVFTVEMVAYGAEKGWLTKPSMVFEQCGPGWTWSQFTEAGREYFSKPRLDEEGSK